MWLITKNGLLSVVQNLDSKGPGDALLVRGRVRGDLEHFADAAARLGGRPEVVETPRADYGFRVTASREVLAVYLAGQVGALDYPNFKSEVAKDDPERAHVYSRVWSVLRDLRWIGGRPGRKQGGRS